MPVRKLQKNAPISFRVSPQLKRELQRLSAKKGMSLAKYIEFEMHGVVERAKLGGREAI